MSDTKGTAVQYPLALDHWPGSTRLLVHDQSGQRLCTVPRDFLLTSAVDAVALLASIVRMCVLEDGRLVDEQLNGVANVAQLDGRRSVWVREDNQATPCTFAKGPRLEYARDLSMGDSDSEQSIIDQNDKDFREALLSRDGVCLVSGHHYRACKAALIIPPSRPEYYGELFGELDSCMHKPQHGLLVNLNLQCALERGEWALRPEGDNLIVHVLCPRDDMRAHHGKVIPSSFFRSPAHQRPHRKVLLFHYQQCVLMYMRSFSAGPRE